MEDKLRTETQNRSLHKFCTEMADVLNENGISVPLFLKDFEIDWSKEMVKSVIRSIGKQKFDKESTTLLTTKEIQSCYEEFNRRAAQEGIHVPWPSQESSENYINSLELVNR